MKASREASQPVREREETPAPRRARQDKIWQFLGQHLVNFGRPPAGPPRARCTSSPRSRARSSRASPSEPRCEAALCRIRYPARSGFASLGLGHCQAIRGPSRSLKIILFGRVECARHLFKARFFACFTVPNRSKPANSYS